jgi:microcystin-dependent protein
MTDIDKEDIKKLIYETYKIDVQAIKNLSTIAVALQKDGLILPGNGDVKGKLNVVGDIETKGKLNVVGDIETKGKITSTGTINALGEMNVLNKITGASDINANGKIKESNMILIPSGIIVAFSGAVAPAGWVLCNGQNNTPNLLNRFIFGSEFNAIGQIGGLPAITLNINQIPAHTHSYNNNGITKWASGASDARSPIPTLNSKQATTSTGGGQPINILPPYYKLAYIMKI